MLWWAMKSCRFIRVFKSSGWGLSVSLCYAPRAPPDGSCSAPGPCLLADSHWGAALKRASRLELHQNPEFGPSSLPIYGHSLPPFRLRPPPVAAVTPDQLLGHCQVLGSHHLRSCFWIWTVLILAGSDCLFWMLDWSVFQFWISGTPDCSTDDALILRSPPRTALYKVCNASLVLLVLLGLNKHRSSSVSWVLIRVFVGDAKLVFTPILLQLMVRSSPCQRAALKPGTVSRSTVQTLIQMVYWNHEPHFKPDLGDEFPHGCPVLHQWSGKLRQQNQICLAFSTWICLMKILSVWVKYLVSAAFKSHSGRENLEFRDEVQQLGWPAWHQDQILLLMWNPGSAPERWDAGGVRTWISVKVVSVFLCSGEEDTFRFGGSQNASLLFADDVIRLV